MKYSRSTFSRLWGYLRPYWKLELATLAVMCVIAALVLVLPGALRYMIDELIPSLAAQSKENIDWTPVLYFALVLAAIYVGQIIFSYLRDYLASYLGGRIVADLRSQLFWHLENLSLNFYQKHQIGEMMSRLLSDVTQVQYLLITTVLMMLTNVLMLVAIFLYLLTVNWYMTLIALIPVPITIYLTRRFGFKMNTIARLIQEATARLSARFQEAFLSVRTIKAFGREKYERDRVDVELNNLTSLYVRNGIVMSLANNVVHFVNMVGPIAVLAWGTYLVATGDMKLGALMAFYMLLAYLYNPIEGLASLNVQMQQAMASVKRIFEYLDIPTAVKESENPVKLERVSGEIEFRNVSFSYPDSGFAIENLNVTIKPRETVALVGPSGAGKTTIINLIMRFFDPDSGEVLLDGIDIRYLSFSTLRNHIAIVDQDPILFKTTMFANIAYSNPDATLERVQQAAQVANIHELIQSLPRGYDSEVGERGVTLSGGEKQRMCLARAILKDPSVLILDEATSSLDSVSERLIQESLTRILADKTAIVIAHRLSTVQHADRIITLDKGRIVDQGKHEELMERSSLYRDLATRQLRG